VNQRPPEQAAMFIRNRLMSFLPSARTEQPWPI
jgi:hypothetical protein